MLENLSYKKHIVSFCFIFIFIGLILLPVRIGTNANERILGLSYLENISQEYCNNTLIKAMAAYGIAKVVNKTISTIQHTEINITPAGIGVTVAPGEILAAANDGIEMVSSALFTIMGIMLVQKITLGIISFFCLKLLFPASIILILLARYLPNIFPWGKRLGLMFAKMAFVILVFFPLSALISDYVEKAFVSAEYENSLRELGLEANKLQRGVIGEDVPINESLKIEEDSEGWFDSFSSVFVDFWQNVKDFSLLDLQSMLKNKAIKVAEYADNMIDKLFIIFSMFVLTVIIIPLSVFYIFITLMRFFANEAQLLLLERT